MVKQCQHAVQASDHDDRRNYVGGVLNKIQQDLADKLKVHHHIPAPDTDQCADTRLGLSKLARKQPYNAKSAACLIQASLSRATSMPELSLLAMHATSAHPPCSQDTPALPFHRRRCLREVYPAPFTTDRCSGLFNGTLSDHRTP